MSLNNKIILRVRKDRNGWYQFSKGNKRLQLAWDSRPWMPWFWLKQYAISCWLPNFMADFSTILSAMEKENAEIFSLYEMPEVEKWILSNI